jgi:hypothetical protein
VPEGQHDYRQLLADLEQERENIERMIVWVKGRMQQADSVQAIESPNSKGRNPINPIRYTSLAPDTFFRMSVPDAIKKYLNIAKRPKTAKDITAALDSGGLTHQAKNLYATVYPTLLRMEGNNDVARVGKGEWGLTEWYPRGTKANQEEKTESES